MLQKQIVFAFLVILGIQLIDVTQCRHISEIVQDLQVESTIPEHKEHECISASMQEQENEKIRKFDELKEKIREIIDNGQEEDIPEQYSSLAQQIKGDGRRHLAATPYQQPTTGNTDYIRIKFDTVGIDNNADVSEDQKVFINQQLNAAKAFYEKRFRVIRLTSTLVVSTPGDACRNGAVTGGQKTTGVSDADFFVYVTAENATSESYLAYAVACQYEQNIFDGQSKYSRPLVANLHFNLKYLTDFGNSDFGQNMETSLHELAHALGFTKSFFDSFVDVSGGTPKVMDGIQTSKGYREMTVRGVPRIILHTPNVRKWVVEHFGCPELLDKDATGSSVLIGMQMEDQGSSGSAGSHWERTLVYDELMTASRLGPSKTFTGLTFAFFKDTGYYLVDDSNSENLQWGYQKGCGFIENACNDEGQSYPEFCSGTDNSSLCSNGREGKGACIPEAQLDAYFMDKPCKLVSPYSNGSCIDESDAEFDFNAEQSRQTYKYSDSRCFESTLGGGGTAKCYKFECQSDKLVIILKGNPTEDSINCEFEGQKITHSSMSGEITCPDPIGFCQQRRIFCPNWCEKKGYCSNGICNCLEGKGGQQCQYNQCPNPVGDQFYQQPLAGNLFIDVSTNLCIDDCATKTGYYSDIMNRVCEKCFSSCNTCEKGGFNKCKDCKPGLARYLYTADEGSCVKNCPIQHYENAGQCAKCTNTNGNSCKTCDKPNSCLSCFSSSEYIYIKDDGAGNITERQCVNDSAACTAIDAAMKFDHSKKQCFKNCPNWLVPGDSGDCQLCSSGTYKVSTIQGTAGCKANCSLAASNTYPDNTERFCKTCHANCVTCRGGESTNCLSCQPNNYLFAGNCFADKSQCPQGSYGNSSFQCVSCHKACLVCEDSTVNKCDSCSNGYYLQNRSCVQSCNLSQFKDNINRACTTCHSSCAQCDKPKAIHCTKCPSGKYLVYTGINRECKDGCPAGQFNNASNVCQPCYSTCKTCRGLTENDCWTCIDKYSLHTYVKDTNGLKVTVDVCLFKCPEGFYSQIEDVTKINKCVACHADCKKCTGVEQNQCTSCYSDKTLPYLNGSQCVTTCPAEKPLNEITGECYGLVIGFVLIQIFLLLIIV